MKQYGFDVLKRMNLRSIIKLKEAREK